MDELIENELTSSTDPYLWLEDYLRAQGISYDYKTDGLREQQTTIEPKVILAKIRLALSASSNARLKTLVPDAMLIWKHRQAQVAINALRAHVAYNQSNSDLLATWVLAVTRRSDPLDIAVMKHFIWQVKRKLFGLPVENHMMPILYGKSGGGKSVAVSKLIESLESISLTTNMNVFEDRFGKRQFSRNYIMFFDELSGAKSVDINSLKQVITSPTMEWRIMHSEGVQTAPQNCTFIGCTNEPVRDRLQDPTSSRRFWQLNCADRLDWSMINSISYEDLWRSINECQLCPVSPHLDEIRKVQDQVIRHKDSIEMWLEDKCEPCPFYEESPTTSVLYDLFKAWCEWQALSYPGLQSFARALPMRFKNLGWNVFSKHSNNGTAWSIRTR